MDVRLKRLLEFHLSPDYEDEKSVDEYLKKEQIDTNNFREEILKLINEPAHGEIRKRLKAKVER